jgi:hypothetical protein
MEPLQEYVTHPGGDQYYVSTIDLSDLDPVAFVVSIEKGLPVTGYETAIFSTDESGDVVNSDIHVAHTDSEEFAREVHARIVEEISQGHVRTPNYRADGSQIELASN